MDVEVPGVECRECGSAMKVTVEDIAKQRTKRCPRGHAVQMKDQGGGVGKVNKAHDDLMKALKKFGK
jgi:hypothetical protein